MLTGQQKRELSLGDLLQADLAVPGLGPALGVIAVRHDANAHQLSRRFAKGGFEIGANVALVVAPLVQTQRAGLNHYLAHPVRARTMNNGANRPLIAPDVHQGGVRHLFAGYQTCQLVERRVFGREVGPIPLEGQHQAYRRVIALARCQISILDEGWHQP